MDGQVPEAVKRRRLAWLQQLLGEQQLAFNRATVGSVQPVLLERRGARPGQLAGRSPFMQAVHVEAPERLVGRCAEVRIDEAHPNSLGGTVLTDARHGAAEPAAAPGDSHRRASA